MNNESLIFRPATQELSTRHQEVSGNSTWSGSTDGHSLNLSPPIDAAQIDGAVSVVE